MHVPQRQTPSGIEQRLLARARRQGLQPGDLLVVGFSGGRDSLVLAAALRRVEQVLRVQPVLVHVDHHLRTGSDIDAARAMDLAVSLGLEAATCRLPAHPAEVHPGVGIEEAARRERYRVLFAEADARKAAAVVTAHHQADQAETVLLHLLRGGGVHGASGMAEWTAFATGPIPEVAGHNISPETLRPIGLWRPFLSETRGAIDVALHDVGLQPIEDPSNVDRELRRNALRHEVLPLLETHFPGATAALARYAELAADDDRALQEMVEQLYPSAVDPGGYFQRSALAEQPLALRRRLLREWVLRKTGIELLSAERTSALLGLSESGEPGKFVEVGGGWRVRYTPDALHVETGGTHGRDRGMGER